MYVGKPEAEGKVADYKRKRLRSLIIAKSDMFGALSATEYFLKEVKDIHHPLYRSFQDVIIVTYCRPFVESRGGVSIGDKHAKVRGRPDLYDMHCKLLKMRNKFVAHSDADIRTVVIVPRGNKFEYQDKRTVDTAYYISNQRLHLDDFNVVYELCRWVGGSIDLECKKLLSWISPPTDTPGGPYELLPHEDDEPLITPATRRDRVL